MVYTQEQLQGFLTDVRDVSEDIKNIDISSLISEFQENVSDLEDLLNIINKELKEAEDKVSLQTAFSIQLKGAIDEAVAASNNAAS